MRVFLLLALVGAVVAQNGFFSIPGVRTRPQRFRQPQRTRRPQQFRQQSFRPQQQQPNSIQENIVDDTNGNSEYHYSWRHRQPAKDGNVARRYCTGLGGGWRGVSIEDGGENTFISRVISGEGLKYIWTGGVKSGRGFHWENAGPVQQFTDWSHTGGANRPQPDNRDRNENCLAILNNFYGDSIKWHDVACHHPKQIICERPKRS